MNQCQNSVDTRLKKSIKRKHVKKQRKTNIAAIIKQEEERSSKNGRLLTESNGNKVNVSPSASVGNSIK